jgi:hypothetical protein
MHVLRTEYNAHPPEAGDSRVQRRSVTCLSRRSTYEAMARYRSESSQEAFGVLGILKILSF